jgi:hypothetical protein
LRSRWEASISEPEDWDEYRFRLPKIEGVEEMENTEEIEKTEED